MLYKENWDAAKNRWNAYWKQANTGRPLLCLIGIKPDAERLPEKMQPANLYERYRDAGQIVARYRHFCDNHVFLADSFPNLSVDFGPGSIAGYLGSEIVFHDDTVWFSHCVEDWKDFPDLVFNPENKWWKEHYRLIKDVRALAGDDFYIGIPDLMENIDILASMRGVQDMIFDMVDEPDEVARRIRQVSDAYFEYYDRFYDLVKSGKDGGSCYTVFQIWGNGRTAKLQCDFSALMSPQNFRELIQQPLREQARRLDNVLYHLDGPDAIKHTGALMEIKEIDALQWTSGDHGPDGTLEDWDVIYDQVRRAGKSIWVKVYSGGYDDWIRGAERVVMKYGSRGLFFHFPSMPEEQARRLLEYADRNWSDIEGTFTW
ncbi:MAG: trimethylamine corrinoid protein 2 [Oscillospiraceae bacterium]|nr:trimethylamine corrinoid protein 2 [Oscillospiraceae bacterium]